MQSTSKNILQLNQLNRDASRIENQLDQKLGSFSKLISRQLSPSSNDSSSSNNHARSFDHSSSRSTIRALEVEIDSLFSQLQTITQQMRQLTNTVVDGNNNSDNQKKKKKQSDVDDVDDDDDEESSVVEVPSHLIYQRDQHAQVLQNLQLEYKRLKQNANRANLLGYDDTNNVNSDNGRSGDNGWTSRINRTMADRDAIINIDSMANALLDSANSIRGSMSQQRNLLTGANAKLVGMRARFPVIDSVIGRIQQRRQRDMIILSFFIAFCIIVTWFLL